jgi:Transglutaminase-like superfamily
MRVIHLVIILILTCCAAAAQQKVSSPRDEQLYALARTDLKAFAQLVSKDASSELSRTQAIVHWLTQHFEWKETDYKTRTVQEIIERRGGNCNDLALVALAAMKELHIELRRVHEVHIRSESPQRGERAHTMVKEKGNSYSIFGRRHNDHVWLEVYDSSAHAWFPADPWSGLVGTDEWIKARVWFGKRFSLNPDAEEMIVPFAIFAADADGKFTINRTQHYLVDEFDRIYSGKLHNLPAWKQWVSMLDLLGDKVQGALSGTTNLQEYESQIDSLAATYEELRTEFRMSHTDPHND